MRAAELIAALLACLAAPSAARAWDDPMLWNNPAHGGGAAPGQTNAIMPGGGGIFGTGGQRDYYITCANCHINDAQQQGAVDLSLVFNPPLVSLNGNPSFKPNQLYQVTAQLMGEHLGLSGCGQFVNGNINNIGVAVEDGSGNPAGVLSSDTGQTATACPATMPTVSGGTTMMYGDCHAVFSMGDKTAANRASWSFTWKAPAAGSGQATIFWGVVDGDCKMDSFGDDVKTGRTTLVEGAAALPARRPYALALLLLLPLAALFTRRARKSS